jgi:D-tyrosyl-tRNA(Tyr) deacylase
VRALLQRVAEASVAVAGEAVARIGPGLLVLLGVRQEDGDADADYMARKIADLRIFDDEEGRLNLSVKDCAGQVLLVSQFTLYGDCRKGRRPSFTRAAAPEHADALYQAVARKLREHGLEVQTGRFQEHMDVALVNRGPVTVLLDSEKAF